VAARVEPFVGAGKPAAALRGGRRMAHQQQTCLHFSFPSKRAARKSRVLSGAAQFNA
jgi:hypothetical protein